jgi:hypothetical protein
MIAATTRSATGIRFVFIVILLFELAVDARVAASL